MTEIELAWKVSFGLITFDSVGRIERFSQDDLGHCNLRFICNLVLEIWNFITFIHEWEYTHDNFKVATFCRKPLMVGFVPP